MGRCRGDGAKPTPTPTPNQETHLVESSAGKATAQVHDELSVAQVRFSEMHISPISPLYLRCASRRYMTA